MALGELRFHDFLLLLVCCVFHSFFFWYLHSQKFCQVKIFMSKEGMRAQTESWRTHSPHCDFAMGRSQEFAPLRLGSGLSEKKKKHRFACDGLARFFFTGVRTCKLALVRAAPCLLRNSSLNDSPGYFYLSQIST